MFNDLYAKVEKIKYLLVSQATGEDADDTVYKDLRQQLIRNTYINSHLPGFLRECRSLTEFWGHIKKQSPTYQGRRDYLRDEFNHVLTIIEERIIITSPVDSVVSDTIEGHIDYEYVQQVWQKALVRRTTDPDGAITIARTLLEATCKYIMDEAEHKYDDKAELPQLYKGVQELLNLAPSEHTEQIFKEILSGCISVVKGLGSLRNKLSDAHSRNRKVPAPSTRHAQFAVNIAGSTAEFLISSWEEKKGRESK